MADRVARTYVDQVLATLPPGRVLVHGGSRTWRSPDRRKLITFPARMWLQYPTRKLIPCPCRFLPPGHFTNGLFGGLHER
jgi:hypothetical protein